MIASKLMMLGDIGVGKTSLVRRLVFDQFAADYKSTLGVELYKHDVLRADGETHRLIIWDMDGDIGESVQRHVYMKGAAGALILADITRPETWNSMMRLAASFEDELPGRPFRLVFNKSDLVTQPVDLEGYIKDRDNPPTVTSANTGHGVNAVFESLAETIARRKI